MRSFRFLQTTKITKTNCFYNQEVMESPQYFQPTDMAKSIDVEEFTKQMALNSIDTFSTLFEDLVRARQEGVPYFNSRYFRYSFKICGTLLIVFSSPSPSPSPPSQQSPSPSPPFQQSPSPDPEVLTKTENPQNPRLSRTYYF